MSIDTGSTSIHVGKTDKDNIEDLGWENVGVSKIFSRALRKAAKFDAIQEEKKEEIREIERKYDL